MPFDGKKSHFLWFSNPRSNIGLNSNSDIQIALWALGNGKQMHLNYLLNIRWSLMERWVKLSKAFRPTSCFIELSRKDLDKWMKKWRKDHFNDSFCWISLDGAPVVVLKLENFVSLKQCLIQDASLTRNAISASPFEPSSFHLSIEF